jgi:hypothetical protein
LSSFTDVANVLAALQRDAEALQVQLYAEETARQSLDITTERFQAGAIAYLALLDAQRTYQQARILLVIAQANRYEDTVALFTALGGGWWNRQDVREEYATTTTRTMNRYEPQGSMTAQRPPKRRLWLWLPLVVVIAVVVYGSIAVFPMAAFMAKGFPAPPPASVATAKAGLRRMDAEARCRRNAQSGAWRRSFGRGAGHHRSGQFRFRR